MSDIVDTGQAEAPAPAPRDVPIDTEKAIPTKPLGNQAPTAPKPEAPAEKPSAREAVQRAMERSKAETEAKNAPAPKEPPAAKPAAEKAEAQPAKEAQPRDNGRFAPKQAPEPSDDEPPARLSAEAKAAWKDAPEAVRRDTHRAIKEMTQGIEKYRPAAEYQESLREREEAARKEGSSVAQVYDQYLAVSQALRSSDQNTRVSAVQEILEHAGISPRDYAAFIMGQSPDQQQSQQDGTIRELRQQVQQLQQHIGRVSGHIEQSQQRTLLEQVNSFAADKPHFEQLAGHIASLLEKNDAEDLDEAYAIARAKYEYRNGALTPPPPVQQMQQPAAEPAPQPEPLNPAGSKSVSGAPFAGSNLAGRRGPPPSPREAIERALRARG